MTSSPKASASEQPLGRRERGKNDKRTRIHGAAAELFAERGYAAVTTQDIADRADVAIGTLFRYASSKAELLTMVYNAELSANIDAGIATGIDAGIDLSVAPGASPATSGLEPADEVLRLFDPLLASALRHPENVAVYQREILFGDPDGVYRAEALELIDRLEASIAAILGRLAGAGTGTGDGTGAASGARTGEGTGVRLRADVDVTLAARSIFSALHMEIIRSGLGREAAESLPGTLRAEVELLMRGLTIPPSAP